MNDSLRTDIFLRYSAETIACACIELAARNLHIALPRNPKWYLTFGAEPEEVHQIMIAILRLYKHQPKPLEELEKCLSALRDKREDEKRKSRPELGNDSPAPQATIPPPLASTVTNPSTPTIAPVEPPPSVITRVEEVPQPLATTNGTTRREGSQDSCTVTDQRHERPQRRKRGSTRSDRSSSKSSSRSPTRHSQKKKKSSRRSRSRSRSPSRRKHRHQSHRKRERKHRSRSSSREESSYPKSAKDANNNTSHQRHHSSKQTNGISHRKVYLK